MSSRFIHVVLCVRISFLFKTIIFHCINMYITHLPVSLLTLMWGCLHLWMTVSRVVLLWTLGKFLFKFLLSVLWGIHPGEELLDHMVIQCLIFQDLPYCFPQWLHHFTFLLAVHKGSISVQTYQRLSYFIIFFLFLWGWVGNSYLSGSNLLLFLLFSC